MKRVIVLLAAFTAACESLTETPQRQPLGADLAGSTVKPTAVATTGQGSFSATLHALAGDATMDYALTFSGLVGEATAVHLHGPANADNVGDLLVDFAALPAGSTGTITLDGVAGEAKGTLDLRVAITSTVSGETLHRLLDAGLVYVDVHTDSATAGEIRGQIRKR